MSEWYLDNFSWNFCHQGKSSYGNLNIYENWKPLVYICIYKWCYFFQDLLIYYINYPNMHGCNFSSLSLCQINILISSKINWLPDLKQARLVLIVIYLPYIIHILYTLLYRSVNLQFQWDRVYSIKKRKIDVGQSRKTKILQLREFIKQWLRLQSGSAC